MTGFSVRFRWGPVVVSDDIQVGVDAILGNILTSWHPIPMTTDSESSSSDASEPLTGYELVADMMRRQDEVIAQIDSLNERIESAIKELSEARKLEEQAGSTDQADDESAIPVPQAA